MSKFTSIGLIVMAVLLLASCTAPTMASEEQTPGGVVSVSPSQATSVSPVQTPPANTPSPTPVPTTPPDIAPTVAPTKAPSPSSSVIPAGLVRNSGVIIGTDIAFRKAPDTNSEVLCRLNQGTYVQIVKTNVDAQWHEVRHDGRTGYINRMYICLDSSLDGYAQLNYVGTIVNCSNDVNVRSGPSTDSEIIGVVKKGSSLTILPQDVFVQGWHKVEFEGRTAYISANYLDIGAVVKDNQLSSLTVTGGTLYPSFSPNEYGYVVKATSTSVTIKAKANSGVSVSVGNSGKSSQTVEIPSSGMKTVRISLNGEIRYSLYISRGILTVGTWNIKRGDGKLLMQGRLVYDQQPDIMGIQEAYQNLKASNVVDNLASLKTRGMPYNVLSPTINYSNGGQYGNGLISRYKLSGIETFPLDSGGYEKRLLQKAVVNIDGHKVSIYNTHFSYNSAAVRKKQFEQVIAIMDRDPNKYKILTGDFNAKFNEFSVFKNYTVVNTEDTTYYDYAKNKIDYSAIDNIIVSKNIQVVNSRIIITSFSDHFPVFAYLVLN